MQAAPPPMPATEELPASDDDARSDASGNSSVQSDGLPVVMADDDDDDHEDDSEIDGGGSFQSWYFGVLNSLSQVKYDKHLRWAVFCTVLDFLQIFLLIFSPQFGWVIDQQLFPWKAIKWALLFDPVVGLGYSAFQGVVIAIAVLAVLVAGTCAYVAWCNHTDHWPLVWPLQILRFVFVFGVSTFYIGVLSILLLPFSCNWFSSGSGVGMKYYMVAFPKQSCIEMPEVAYMVVCGVLLLFYCFCAFSAAFTDFDMNLLDRRWLANATSSLEVRFFVCRTLMVAAYSTLFGLSKIQSPIMLLCTAHMLYAYVRWQPHLRPWVNHVKCGLLAMLAWVATMLVVLVYGRPNLQPDDPDFSATVTNITLYALPGPFAAGILASWVRLTLTQRRVLARFAVADPNTKGNLKDVYRFSSAAEAEMVARVCRTYTKEDDEVLDPDAVRLAGFIIKVGMACFPKSFFMTVTFSNFLLEAEGSYQSGASQLQQAKKIAFWLSQRYAVFVRESQARARPDEGGGSGENATDLVTYIEFQRKYSLATRAHRDALGAVRAFWQQLMQNDISFEDLAANFRLIDAARQRADRIYKTVLVRFPTSARLLRNYAAFLDACASSDRWRAAKLRSDAHKFEEEQKNGDACAAMSADVEFSARNAAIIGINAKGIIEMMNRQALEMFGYRRSELEGKNVSMLMPQPFSQRHNTFLKNYITTGKVNIIDQVMGVVALHKDRYVFPTKLLVTKVSGTGADSVFMGVMRQVADDPDVVKVLAMPQGIVMCVDARYKDWFGKGSDECTGKPLLSLVEETDVVGNLLDTAQSHSESEFRTKPLRADGVHISHKYAEPVECNISFELGGTSAQRVYIMAIRKARKTPFDAMLVADQKGRILHMNSEVMSMLSMTKKMRHHLTISKLLGPPHSLMHQTWMKSPSPRVPMQSCRNAATVAMVDGTGTAVPVRPHIRMRAGANGHHYIINLESSSWERALDERRLSLVVDVDGTVQSVVSKTPSSLFGVKPHLLVGKTVASFINVFSEFAKDREELMESVIQRASERPGFSWRVGVHSVMSQEVLEAAGVLQRAVLRKATRPAIMQVEVKEPDGEGELPTLRLHLWRSDVVSGEVEMAPDGTIIKPAASSTHPTGMIFGVSDKKLSRKRISRFIDLPGPKLHSLLDKPKKGVGVEVKGAMKSGTAPWRSRIGSAVTLSARHADGLPLTVQVVAMAKDNGNVVAKIAFSSPTTGDPAAFRRLLGVGDGAAAAGGRPSAAAGTRANSEMLGADAGAGALVAQQQPDTDSEDSSAPDGGGGGGAGAGSDGDAVGGGGGGGGDGDHASDSEMSEDSEAAAAAADAKAKADEAAADLQRRTRFRKLRARLGAGSSFHAVMRYRWQAYTVLGVLLLVHILMFAIITGMLIDIKDKTEEVELGPSATYELFNVMQLSRQLSNIYDGVTNPNWYSAADISSIERLLEAHINDLEHHHQDLFLGGTKLRRLGGPGSVFAGIWEDRVCIQKQYIDTATPYTLELNASLWEMGNHLIASARNVLENHATLAAANGGNLTASPDWQYVLRNGRDAIAPQYIANTDAISRRAISAATATRGIAIAFLVIEGIALAGLSAAWIWWLVRSACAKRYTLFAIFLAVPTALLRGIVSQALRVDTSGEEQQSKGEIAAAASAKAAGAKEFDGSSKLASQKLTMAYVARGVRPKGFVARLAALPQRMWQAVSGSGMRLELNKRSMMMDSRDVMMLMSPFLLWGLLAVVQWAATYALLLTIDEPMVAITSIGRVKTATFKSFFDAHELISAGAGASASETLSTEREALAGARNTLVVTYEAMLFGTGELEDPTGLLLPNWMTVPASLFLVKAAVGLFFRNHNVCYAKEDTDTHCFDDLTDKYYQITNHAINPMVLRTIEEARLMENDADADINMTSPRFDFMWKVVGDNVGSALTVGLKVCGRVCH